jgi:hypothetical protein
VKSMRCADVAAGSIQYDAHPLDSAPSPLLRALPAYEREFRGHLRRAQALQAAGAARLAAAEQLIAEMVGTGTAVRSVNVGGRGLRCCWLCSVALHMITVTGTGAGRAALQQPDPFACTPECVSPTGCTRQTQSLSAENSTCASVDLQDVQGLAIDAARSNVERHYVYIQEACADFMRRYRGQVLSCILLA